MKKTTAKKLQAKQDALIKKIPMQYRGIVNDIINIEYRLTMVEEGHDSELEI